MEFFVFFVGRYDDQRKNYGEEDGKNDLSGAEHIRYF